MKKVVIITLSAFIFSTLVTSCRTHTPCAGVTSHLGKAKVSPLIRPL